MVRIPQPRRGFPEVRCCLARGLGMPARVMRVLGILRYVAAESYCWILLASCHWCCGRVARTLYCELDPGV